MARFLWYGSAGVNKFQLVHLADLSRPYDLHGSGVMDLNTFGKYLIIISMWRYLTGTDMVHHIFMHKYCREKPLFPYVRLRHFGSMGGSIFWSSFLKV